MRIGGWIAWRRHLVVWLPAILFALANVAGYFLLGGSAGGRAASLRADVQQLDAECQQLTRLEGAVKKERDQVESLRTGLDEINKNVFGSLEQRLTSILREVETATTMAGLRPARFSYDAKEDSKTNLTRFGITFTVNGTFQQIEQLLQALRSSQEFLIVDRLRLVGEEGTQSRELGIAIHVSTCLSSADKELLERLLGTSGKPGKEADSGAH